METKRFGTIEEHFGDLIDPLKDRTKRHELLDIVAIAICGVICGADSWVDIELFGNSKQAWLKQYLSLPNEIPSHDTFGRVFSRLDPEKFRECFMSWVRAVSELTKGEVVTIDGKTFRRARREFWMHNEPPTFLGVFPDATPSAPSHTAVEEESKNVLRGMPASVGVVQGTAKVAQTLEGADKVQQGDILVCRTTSPAWPFLFSRIAAVVADGGAILSHCAIVAREYNIPCVVGARGATDKIRDGMNITVDGGKGTVEILS